MATNVLNRVKSTPFFEMFSTELKFTVDVLLKWFNDVFESRFNELDAVKKQILKEKSVVWSSGKCLICDLKLAVSLKEGCEKTKKITIWYNFTVQKEQLLLRNIYSKKDLKKSKNFSEKIIAYNYFVHIVRLLNKYYYKNSNIEDVDHEVMETLLERTLNLKCNSFLELYHDIEKFTVKSTDIRRKKIE